MGHSHEGHGHSHDAPGGDHGHTHEILDGPGSYMGREMPIIEGRNWNERAFTIGIGGLVFLFLSYQLDQSHPSAPVPKFTMHFGSTEPNVG